jgi:hypothetical protein
MKPLIPPPAVAVVCQKPLEEQARSAGLSLRQFVRHIRQGWDNWRVVRAERWCAACGLDFWHLDVSAKVREVDWMKLTPMHRRALHSILKAASGREPTAGEIRALAKTLSRHG